MKFIKALIKKTDHTKLGIELHDSKSTLTWDLFI